MPELPEVETTKRGLSRYLTGLVVTEVILRQPKLRWPVDESLRQILPGQKLAQIDRRAKYLLLRFASGTLIIHLGMSGSLRVLAADTPAEKHDHIDLIFGDLIVRYRDPRRFGAMLWTTELPQAHPLLAGLGPEPLTDEFDGKHLFDCSRGRKQAVKSFLMDGQVVVGVGNIYASEALFLAGISPLRAAGKISALRYERLASAVRQVLSEAVARGGTTLQDFTQVDGNPGYFSQQLLVYGRAGAACTSCGRPIKLVRIGQRSSFYCNHCQK